MKIRPARNAGGQLWQTVPDLHEGVICRDYRALAHRKNAKKWWKTAKSRWKKLTAPASAATVAGPSADATSLAVADRH